MRNVATVKAVDTKHKEAQIVRSRNALNLSDLLNITSIPSPQRGTHSPLLLKTKSLYGIMLVVKPNLP